MPITSSTRIAELTADDLLPYRERYVAWSTSLGTAAENIDQNWNRVVASPADFSVHLSRFRAWLVDQTSVDPLPTTTGDRRSTAEALAAMRRRERDAKADAHQARQELINARVALAEAHERAAQPFDSSHPGWRDFWLTAARNATRSGHCPEYDKHAELMGGITRDQFRSEGESLYERESVSYTVTVTFTHSELVDSGADSWIVDADGQSLARLAYDNRYDLTDYSVEEEEREEYGD